MKTKTYKGESYAIVLDASYDLWVAGHPNDLDACKDFEDRYMDAAEEIAEKCGIEIKVVFGNYEGPAMQEQTSHGDEGDLWQDIHNQVIR